LQQDFKSLGGLVAGIGKEEIMAKFSFHCQCYKSGQLGGLDKHNRRLNKNYSNADIDKDKNADNRVYIAPQQSLYKDCKDQIEKRVVAHGGRITKISNWICECIFSYPDELPLERLDEYNALILKYMSARFGADNMIMAVCHSDEGGCPHLHLDMLVITEDNRLSSKTLITRDFITSMHKVMPLILKKGGFDIEEYEETEEVKQGGLSAKEYKKKMEEENKELNNRLDKLTVEYNNLVDEYNGLVKDKKTLEKNNKQKAYEIIEKQERTR